ncbi:MAG: NADH-quinone oxidoreductase subunit NuoF [Thermotogaceae bacterium]|nr:NADH-quinone oxidoreductase subunit NuoF [Thermotogaceae bacterium]
MQKITRPSDLNVLREKLLEEKHSKLEKEISFIIGYGTCGKAAGADKILDVVKDLVPNSNITTVGCIGMCWAEPLLDVVYPGGMRVSYMKVTEKVVEEIVKTALSGEVYKENIVGVIDLKKELFGEKQRYFGYKSLWDHDFYKKQERIVLKNCGLIDPENIEDYIAVGGYRALAKVLADMKPEEVIEEVKKSGLRGRSGTGFPTGFKWELVAKQKDETKYVVCNADEGDPGAFMDRAVLEGDPHSVIEGLAIAAYAVGAKKGFIYIRAEYPLAMERLTIAINQAREKGLLGKNILGTKFSFDVEIRAGAGAYVCGEETALMASIMGFRGEPWLKPPFPNEKGLWEHPTVINNVETLANIAWIINNGYKEFRKYGTEKSPGTKVFSLAGRVKHTGVVEVPLGITLRELIFDIGGGISNGKKLKAVQTGGPSGGVVPPDKMDTPIDYESLTPIGTIMGSGGVIVLDEDDCMVDVAKYFLTFTQAESCGQCIPCREGTKRMLDILTNITSGNATIEDLDLLEWLAKYVSKASFCGLGKTAPNPILTTIRYFKNEYISHINDKYCPAGACKDLVSYYIDEKLCKGCTLCLRSCPVGAIRKEGKIFRIDTEDCIKCGICVNACSFNAIKTKGVA